MEKLIITAAICGAEVTKEHNPAVPYTVEEMVREAKSAFELISIDGDSIRADWKTALCNQPAIKEEMARIESEGQVPTFVVSVSSIVANDGTYAEN